MNGMGSFEYRGPHPLHDKIEKLEGELEQARMLLANQKELIMHLYAELDKRKEIKDVRP